MGALGLIGGGLMGTAIIKGLLKQGYPANAICVADPDPARRQLLAELGVATFADNRAMLAALNKQEADGVILAVKPQVVPEALAGLDLGGLPLLSIVAGYKVAALEALLPAGTKVLRAMPNTPALIGAGITALALGAQSGSAEQDWAEKVLRSLGQVVLVPESLMDAVTGLSGSGPGYVYLFIEALIDGGVLAGLPRALARELAVATVLGSARMVAETNEHPAVLRDMVTSPGGTTIAGLHTLEEAGFSGQVMRAVLAATDRAKALGEGKK
ncbi:pyrroline-5-carboxylate reductase [Capillibacterium thermochitinicola]|nr:pyrroline-5-carboxylate reductase [Capillibacterium thermochitinicola]